MMKLWALIALLAALVAGSQYGTPKDGNSGEVTTKDGGNPPPPWP